VIVLNLLEVVPCGTSTITPDFSSIPISYCLNETTTDLPTSSEDSPAITGTWAPVRVNKAQREQAIMFSHQILFQPLAALIQNLNCDRTYCSGFRGFSICSGEPAPTLSTTSPNGITGTWMPPIIDNMNSASCLRQIQGKVCSPNQ
jgi:hypothetical protein